MLPPMRTLTHPVFLAAAGGLLLTAAGVIAIWLLV